jgi:hypothetical protein
MKPTPKQFKKFLLALILITGLLYLTIPVVVAAPYGTYLHFPDSPDKADPTVPEQIRIIAHQKGFEYPDYLVDLSYCESRWNTTAINLNGGHSLDVGVMQWNMKYHPEVGIKCALDVNCAVSKAIEAINAGKQGMWVCDRLIR